MLQLIKRSQVPVQSIMLWQELINLTNRTKTKTTDGLINAVLPEYQCFLQRGRIACNAEHCNTYGNSVHPSVCPSHAGTLSRRMKIESGGLHCQVAKSILIFWHQLWLHSKWPTLSEKRRLRPIFAYNVSTVRASEKSSVIANRKSTTRFPTSYRWSPYVTPNSPKGWLKK